MVSGPSTGDGQDWRARDAFVFAEANHQAPNVPPTANFTAGCNGALCSFTSTSADPDGSIVNWSWNFGDGTPPGSGANPTHTYTTSGTKAVTLTVTDNRGGTATRTVNVDVVVPSNAPPVAVIVPNCGNLTCGFNGSSSTDDVGIISWAWNYGDNTTGSGAVAPHTYANAGTYTVQLTVTDGGGLSNTATTQVAVSPAPPGAIAFRANAESQGNTIAQTVQIPPSVQAGDRLVLVSTQNRVDVTVGGPAGWTLVNSGSDAGTTIQTFAWTKVATAADAGANVSITNSDYTKTTLQVVAYSGVGSISAQSLAFDAALSTTHTTPTVAVATNASTVLSVWTDRTSLNTGWTLPAGVTLRSQTTGTGSGHMTTAVGSTSSVPAGTSGGFTATSQESGRRAAMWSIVLAP